MQNVIDWIRTNSNGIVELVRSAMFMLLGFGLLRQATGEPWTDAQIALVLGFVSTIGALITQKTTVAANKVDQRVSKARAQGVREGERGTR